VIGFALNLVSQATLGTFPPALVTAPLAFIAALPIVRGVGALASHIVPRDETFAVSLANFNDEIAERAVTLGGQAYGTARHVAGSSRIPDYPQDTSKDSDHVRLLAERFTAYLATARSVRDTAEEHEDTDTHDLLTQIVTEFEKNAWFLQASLE